MKNRASLLLMEQLIMVFVFALAAAVCLGFFAQANMTARETARQDIAVLIAQNAAEQLKAGENPERNPLQEGFSLQVSRLPSEIPELTTAQITVYYQEEPVFSLITGWQEMEP